MQSTFQTESDGDALSSQKRLGLANSVGTKMEDAGSQNGVGVVRGIREFLNEVTSEHAAGPSGYLAQVGLVPLPPADRAAQRRIALNSILMSR